MERTVCIIGIGERSALVNTQIRREIDPDEAERTRFLTIDYSREKEFEDKDFVFLDQDDSILYNLAYLYPEYLDELNSDEFHPPPKEFDPKSWTYPGAEATDESGKPLKHKDRLKKIIPIYQTLSKLMDDLSRYQVSNSQSLPRFIVHTCLNLDHPFGISESTNEAVYSTSHKVVTKRRIAFSRKIFFSVMFMIGELAKKKKVRIEIFPVLLLRTAILDPSILIEQEQIFSVLLQLNAEMSKNPFFKIGYLIQDTNSRNNKFYLAEHISLLYLHILVLGNLTQSIRELKIQEEHLLNHVLFNLDGEPTKSEQRWASLGFIDGVLQFKTLKRELGQFLTKEALELILKEEEIDSNLSQKLNPTYSSSAQQIQLESLFLSLLRDYEGKGKPSFKMTLERFYEKINSKDIEKRQTENHNILSITSGEKENQSFEEYLAEFKNLKNNKSAIRKLPEIWAQTLNYSSSFIIKIKEMAKDFLQPTRMREIDMHVKKISKELIHDFRLLCTIIAGGDTTPKKRKEFYDPNLEKFVSTFFNSIKTHHSWKYLRESLQKAFRIFQYEIYNKSLQGVNESVLKVEELRNYSLSKVSAAIEKERKNIESIPTKKAILFFTIILLLGFALTNFQFLRPVPFIEGLGILDFLAGSIIQQITISSGFQIYGKVFYLKDLVLPFILLLIGFLFFSIPSAIFSGRFAFYKNGIESEAYAYESKVRDLFKEMFQINLSLRLSGLLMEYVHEMEKSFILLNDFESKCRDLIRKLEVSCTGLYALRDGEKSNDFESLRLSSFSGLKVHPNQADNAIIVSLLKVDFKETMKAIRTSLIYEGEDINRIKKTLLQFDQSTENSFEELEVDIEKGIQFQSLQNLSRDWKFSTIPPNPQSYIPLKVYTSDFQLGSFPIREYEQKELGSSELLNSYDDHHLITIFFPIRKFSFKEIFHSLSDDIFKSLKEDFNDIFEDNQEEINQREREARLQIEETLRLYPAKDIVQVVPNELVPEDIINKLNEKVNSANE